MGDALKVLRTNVNLLLRENEGKGLGARAALSRAAKSRGSRLAVGTASNIANPKHTGSFSLKSVQKVADLYGKEPWQLLHPTLGRGLTFSEAALEAARYVDTYPEERRGQILAALKLLMPPRVVPDEAVPPAFDARKMRRSTKPSTPKDDPTQPEDKSRRGPDDEEMRF